MCRVSPENVRKVMVYPEFDRPQRCQLGGAACVRSCEASFSRKPRKSETPKCRCSLRNYQSFDALPRPNFATALVGTENVMDKSQLSPHFRLESISLDG
jgi:hypothetical protein